jgi:hypothetical protein
LGLALYYLDYLGSIASRLSTDIYASMLYEKLSFIIAISTLTFGITQILIYIS